MLELPDRLSPRPSRRMLSRRSSDCRSTLGTDPRHRPQQRAKQVADGWVWEFQVLRPCALRLVEREIDFFREYRENCRAQTLRRRRPRPKREAGTFYERVSCNAAPVSDVRRWPRIPAITRW